MKIENKNDYLKKNLTRTFRFRESTKSHIAAQFRDIKHISVLIFQNFEKETRDAFAKFRAGPEYFHNRNRIKNGEKFAREYVKIPLRILCRVDLPKIETCKKACFLIFCFLINFISRKYDSVLKLNGALLKVALVFQTGEKFGFFFRFLIL